MILVSESRRQAASPSVPEDFRQAVAEAAAAEEVMKEVRALVQNSHELKTLRRTYDKSVRVDMDVTSSRKYTRFEMPNCPALVNDMLLTLERLRCEVVGSPLRTFSHLILTIPRLGPINERIEVERST